MDYPDDTIVVQVKDQNASAVVIFKVQKSYTLSGGAILNGPKMDLNMDLKWT